MAKTVENLLFFTHKSSKTNIIESTKINPHFLLQIQDTRLRKIGPNPKTRKKQKQKKNLFKLTHYVFISNQRHKT